MQTSVVKPTIQILGSKSQLLDWNFCEMMGSIFFTISVSGSTIAWELPIGKCPCAHFLAPIAKWCLLNWPRIAWSCSPLHQIIELRPHFLEQSKEMQQLRTDTVYLWQGVTIYVGPLLQAITADGAVKAGRGVGLLHSGTDSSYLALFFTALLAHDMASKSAGHWIRPLLQPFFCLLFQFFPLNLFAFFTFASLK